MGGALVTKCIVSYCQRRARYCHVSRSVHSKSRLTITNKMERFSFKSERAVQVEEVLKEDWPIVLQ